MFDIESRNRPSLRKFYHVVSKIQWNPVNTDTKGTGQIVRINEVSVLSGDSEKKSRIHVFSKKDEGKRLYGNKTLFNCTVTVTNANCELSD